MERRFIFSVGASFTSEPLQRVIDFWGRQLNLDVQVRFGPHNQLFRRLLDGSSLLGSNEHGVNVILARVEDLGVDPANIEANASELIDLIRDARLRLTASPFIVSLCPPSRNFVSGDQAVLARELAARFKGALDATPGMHFIGWKQVEQLYPVKCVHDEHADRLAGIPYTELYFCALGTALVRLTHALFTEPFKVIALDCDFTLWSGICGEDGPRGVVIDAPRLALQQFMLHQHESGMLLTMASKNNEQDVLETFQAHPEMPLQLRDFASWRLNWESKAGNLNALADELALSPDAFIFIDDNPKECAEVEASAPGVLALTLPKNIDETAHFLKHVWAFDHPTVTEEDRNRNRYYEQIGHFERERRRVNDLEQFMANLRLDVVFETLSTERLARAAQLTQRTNQFNFTSIRRTEAEIWALAHDKGHECVTVDVSDRFGHYGIVGLLIYRTLEGVLELDTLALSCRALGRGVEHRMLAWLGEQAVRRGASTVRVRLISTAKNLPARKFMHDIAVDIERVSGSEFLYDLPAVRLRDLSWKPSASSAPERIEEKERALPRTNRRFTDYARIATMLATPEQVRDAMRREGYQADNGVADPASGGVEQRLAGIWGDLLRVPSIDSTDNFFDLGGHSLLAVLLIIRVKEEFGIDLPMDDVYSATLTLGDLARKIEMRQAGDVDEQDYETLLAEIEAMPDEEVRRILEREDAESVRRVN